MASLSAFHILMELGVFSSVYKRVEEDKCGWRKKLPSKCVWTRSGKHTAGAPMRFKSFLQSNLASLHPPIPPFSSFRLFMYTLASSVGAHLSIAPLFLSAKRGRKHPGGAPGAPLCVHTAKNEKHKSTPIKNNSRVEFTPSTCCYEGMTC